MNKQSDDSHIMVGHTCANASIATNDLPVSVYVPVAVSVFVLAWICSIV